MTRLDDATQRLTQAIERIERVLDQASLDHDGANGASAEQIEALRDSLEQARRENASLRQLNEAVVARLDETISQLQSVLES